jgi:hypothetical protein
VPESLFARLPLREPSVISGPAEPIRTADELDAALRAARETDGPVVIDALLGD